MIGGAAGAVFWLAFFGTCIGTWVAMRRHDRKQELDAYERLIGGGWG